MDELNTRFRNGRSSNALEEAGVLVHVNDNLQPSDKESWLPCFNPESWCFKYSDRISTSIISADAPFVFGLGIEGLSGFVIAPWLADVMCSYFMDFGTMNPPTTCDSPGISATCLPGCWKGTPNWCDNDQKMYNCAWRPDALETMLEWHRGRRGGRARHLQRGGGSYNEVRGTAPPTSTSGKPADLRVEQRRVALANLLRVLAGGAEHARLGAAPSRADPGFLLHRRGWLRRISSTCQLRRLHGSLP